MERSHDCLLYTSSHGAIWNNPPYSNIRPWVEKAAEQCIQQRQTVVKLVPEDLSVGWFSKALESVDEVRIITDGPVSYTHLLIITLCTGTIHAQCVFLLVFAKYIVYFFIRVYYGGHMSNLRKYRESLNISQTTLAKACLLYTSRCV